MSASLVGSEMCIRDSSDISIGSCSRPIMSLRCWTCDVRWPSAWGLRPVSYTHLTLPTICSV
eukprot:14191382-Alexandrium_andersonii.AAC.1